MAPPVPLALKRVVHAAERRFRRATRRRRVLPSLLIIGAQRAGTTSLYEYLRRHPDFAGARPADASIHWLKETHFFDENFAQGVDWYRGFFPLDSTRNWRRRRGRDLVAGEATPSYLFHPAAPGRVAEVLPEARLVALLRNPVDRAYSHYQMMRSKGREKLSFREAVEAERTRLAGVEEWLASAQERPGSGRHPNYHHYRHRAYVTRGFYVDQLERWLEHFPREQLLVLKAEDMLAHPRETYGEVLRFASLRSFQLREHEKRNKQPYPAMDADMRLALENRFAQANARLAALLGWEEAWGVPREDYARTPGKASADSG